MLTEASSGGQQRGQRARMDSNLHAFFPLRERRGKLARSNHANDMNAHA